MNRFRIRCKVQFGLFAIFLFRFVLNVLPGSGLRVALLRLPGNSIGRNVGLHRGLWITWPMNISIGDNSTLNMGTFLDSRAPVHIGSNTMIGHRCSIYSASHDLNEGSFGTVKKAVTIGSRVVIFPHCLIMPGTVIEDGAVLLPGSVASGHLAAFEVYGGVPAKRLRSRMTEQSYSLDYTYWFPNS